MQLGQVVCDQHAGGVMPGTYADSIARVGRLIIIGGIALDAEVGAPEAIARADTFGEALTCGVGTG